jgi:ABC-type spermidine/putrescine transport system permease subunit I
MSLGANRFRTFVEVTLPLSLPGIVGAFVIAFTLSISAYATPAILGGPATATMATLIYDFMTSLADWALGSAMGALLIISSMVLLVIGSVLGSKREAL